MVFFVCAKRMNSSYVISGTITPCLVKFFKSVDVAKEEIKIREESEALRYLDIHNIDISNLDIYDLMINTDSFDPESITKIILTTLKVI